MQSISHAWTMDVMASNLLCALRCLGLALPALLYPILTSGSANAASDATRWTTYQGERAGLIFQYPADVFPVAGGDPTDALRDRTAERAGRIFTSADGSAALQVATFPNLDNASVSALRSRAIAASYKDANLEYNRIAATWYVLSGTRGTTTFYERVHFSCEGRRLDVWTVTYPTAKAGVFDELVDEMARRFRTAIAGVQCK